MPLESALTYLRHRSETDFSVETDPVFSPSRSLVRSVREYRTVLGYGKGSARSPADGSGYQHPVTAAPCACFANSNCPMLGSTVPDNPKDRATSIGTGEPPIHLRHQ